MIRRTWEQLPEPVRHEIMCHCGPVHGNIAAPAGLNSEFSATLNVGGGDSMPAGLVFVKGITADHAQSWAHRRERYVNPLLPAHAPRILWSTETAGWLMLGFEHVPGRHANLSPGSADLPLVSGAASAIAHTLSPAPVPDLPELAEQWTRLAAWRRLRHNPPTDLHPWSLSQLDQFVDWGERAVEAVDGASLVHTDLHAFNMLIDGSARVVDWAWSRRAASWVDVGFLVLRLIAAGHTPGEAEHWAEPVGKWSAAPDEARTSFAVAVLGIWEFLQRDRPLPHRARLTDAARRWARHRVG